MRHASREAADRLHLLRLLQALGALAQRRLGAMAVAHVAQDGDRLALEEGDEARLQVVLAVGARRDVLDGHRPAAPPELGQPRLDVRGVVRIEDVSDVLALEPLGRDRRRVARE